MTRNMMVVVMVLVSVSLAFGQTGQSQPPKDQPKPEQPQPPKQEQPRKEPATVGSEKQAVSFETSDGVKIAADYYPPAPAEERKAAAKDKAPVAMLIHMFPADRTSWAPLVPRLTEAGFAVLAYDIRGKGGSTEPASKNLAKLYADQDPALFADAWKDAEAAKKWLSSRPECDVSRIAMIGASIGCSISLEYGSRDAAVKAIVCLSPGTKYFGVDSAAHIKKCGKRAILLMSPRTEHEEVKKLVKASGEVARGEEYPGSREQHGTGMLLAPYGEKVKKRIVEFASEGVGLKEAKSGEKAGKKGK